MLPREDRGWNIKRPNQYDGLQNNIIQSRSTSDLPGCEFYACLVAPD